MAPDVSSVSLTLGGAIGALGGGPLVLTWRARSAVGLGLGMGLMVRAYPLHTWSIHLPLTPSSSTHQPLDLSTYARDP